MITVVVVSVLLALGAPAFVALLERNRLQTGAHTLYTDLMVARSEAIKRNRDVVLCKSPDGQSCTNSGYWEQGWMVYADQDSDGAPDPNEVLSSRESLVAGDTLRSSAFGDAITFRTDGSASGNGVFVICNSDADLSNAREVDVATTGRVRVELTTTDCGI